MKEEPTLAVRNDNVDLAELLARIAMRDRSAFKTLYSQTSANLFGSLMRILKQQSLAEDALQETYVRVWNNASRYRPNSGKPMTWLYSIARYRAIDMLRKRRNDKAEVALDNPGALSQDAMQYIEQLPDVDHSTLARCLGELEEIQRNAIVLCYCEGYSHSELSDRLAKPLGTIKSWIRRGLLALRSCVSPGEAS